MDGWGAFSGVFESATKQWEQIEAQLDQAVGVEAAPAELAEEEGSPTQRPQPVHIGEGDSIPFNIDPTDTELVGSATHASNSPHGADQATASSRPASPSSSRTAAGHSAAAATAEGSAESCTQQLQSFKESPASELSPAVSHPEADTFHGGERGLERGVLEHSRHASGAPEAAMGDTDVEEERTTVEPPPDTDASEEQALPQPQAVVPPSLPPSLPNPTPPSPQVEHPQNTAASSAKGTPRADTTSSDSAAAPAGGATPAAVRTKMAKAKEVISALKARCTTLTTQIKRREEQLALSSQQCAAALTEASESQEKLHAALQRVKKAEAHATAGSSAAEQLQQLRAECAEQREALDSFRVEGEQLSKKQAVQEGTIRSLRTKLKEAEAEKNMERQATTAALEKSHACQQQLEKLQAETAASQSQAASAAQTASTAGSQVEKLQNAFSRSQAEVQSLEAALAAARQEGAAYQSQVSAALEEMGEADEARDALAGQLASANRALKQAQAEADAQRSTARSLRSELAQVRAEAHSAESGWRAEIDAALAASAAAQSRLRSSEAAQLGETSATEGGSSNDEEEGGAKPRQGGLIVQLANCRLDLSQAQAENDTLQLKLTEAQRSHRGTLEALEHELHGVKAECIELRRSAATLASDLQQEQSAKWALTERLQGEQAARGTAGATAAVAASQRDAALAEVASLQARLKAAAAASAAQSAPPSNPEQGGVPSKAATPADPTPPSNQTENASSMQQTAAESAADALATAAHQAAVALAGGQALLAPREETPVVSQLAQLLDRAQVYGLLRSQLNEELQRQGGLVASLRGALDTAQTQAHDLQVQLTGASELLRGASSLSDRARVAEGRAAVLLELLGETQEEVDCLSGELAQVRQAFKEQLRALMQSEASS